MKHLVTIALAIPLVTLLILSCPAMNARSACRDLAHTSGHYTYFEWHGGDTSCWYSIEGQLIPTGLERL